MLASSAMNNLFVTYYLELFMDLVAVPADYFYIGQVILMAWNAVNDPVFGFASDAGVSVTSILKSCCSRTFGGNGELQAKSKNRSNAARAKREPYADVQRSRLNIIRYGGIVWTLSFLFVWMPPCVGHDSTFGFGGLLPSTLSGGITTFVKVFHFVVSMCMYDGMLTLVEVNHSALLADLTTSSDERATLNMYSAICAGIGSLSSFFGHLCWQSSSAGSLLPFQLCCAAVALCSNACFFWGTSVLFDVASNRSPTYSTQKRESREAQGRSEVPSDVSAFVKQMLKHRNFWLFQGFYLIQGFDCAFEKNLFSSFLGRLVGDAVSSEVVSNNFALVYSTVGGHAVYHARNKSAVYIT